MSGKLIDSSFEHHYLPGLAALLAVASWLIPQHIPPWTGFYNELAAFLALGLLLAYCASTAPHFEIPHWSIAIGATALVPLVQTAAGHIYFAGDGWLAAAYLLGLAIAMATGHALAKRCGVGFSASIAWVLLTAAGLTAVIVVYQWLDLRFLGLWVYGAPRTRPFGNIGQANHAATMLCMGLAALAYLRATRRLPVVPALLLAVLLIFSLVLTQSRVPWITAIFATLWWLWKRRSVPAVKAWAFALAIAFYAGLIVFWPHGNATVVTPATEQRPDIRQAGTHFQNWEEMLRAAKERPLWGYGWNQVSVAHVQNARERHTYSEMLTHSHSLPLDLIIWNGVPLGLLILCALGFWLGSRAWRCKTPESWFALLAIASVGIHHLFEFPLDYAYFLLPVGLLIGLIESSHEGGAHWNMPRMLLWLVAVTYALVIGVIWHDYRALEADYLLMRFEARRIGPINTPDSAPKVILLTQLREDLRMARSLARENMTAAELDWMRKITYRYPYYSSLFRYSVSLALNGRRDDATVEFRRLYDIYGKKPYAQAKDAVRSLAETKYPQLADWQLPPP